MSAFPDFSKLRQTVAALGVDLSDCLAELANGALASSELDYVAAPHGFYDVLPTGDIVRLIIHISHGDHSRCCNDPERWHRYHTSRCSGYGPPSRQLKHFKTRRTDGRFTYFLHDFGDNEYRPEDRIKGRPLILCRNCLAKLDHLALLDENGKPNLDELLSGDLAHRLHTEPVVYDHDRIFGIPDVDWHCIALHIKNRAAWHCARCAGDFRYTKKFLHAHYRPGAGGRASLGRVVALCAGCHALEQGHDILRMKLRSASEFVGFRENYPNHSALRV